MVSQLTLLLEVQGSKPYLHPSICTQVLLGPRLTFKCLCNVRTSHVHMLNLTSSLSFPDSHFSRIYNILAYTCDHYPFHTCTLHLLVFVCSTRFSHRCRKSSRHPPPPNCTSFGTCQEEVGDFGDGDQFDSSILIMYIPST